MGQPLGEGIDLLRQSLGWDRAGGQKEGGKTTNKKMLAEAGSLRFVSETNKACTKALIYGINTNQARAKMLKKDVINIIFPVNFEQAKTLA